MGYVRCLECLCLSLKVSLDHWLPLPWLAFSSVGTGDLVSLGLLSLPDSTILGRQNPPSGLSRPLIFCRGASLPLLDKESSWCIHTRKEWNGRQLWESVVLCLTTYHPSPLAVASARPVQSQVMHF